MSPYRTPAATEPPAREDGGEPTCPDGDLFPVLALLWIGSLVRVALGIACPEGRALDFAPAVLAVVVLPYVLARSLSWSLRRAIGRPSPRARRRAER
jgi:hypothetical protein